LQKLKNILSILTANERNRFYRLAALDIIISILDIAFLAGMLVVINYYSKPAHTITFLPFKNILEKYPYLLIIAFFFLFSLKNMLGYSVIRMQYHFVYNVASRLSKKKLLDFLRGSYSDYTGIDSSVYIRKISQQPIEFGHYILRGVQTIITQSVLILFTIIAILIYSSLLFSLLFIILIPPVLLLSLLLKKRLNEARLMGKKTSEKAIQHLKEALSAYVESNIYDKHEFFSNRYFTYQARLNNYLSEQQVIQNLPPRLIEVFAVFGLLVLVLLNSFLAGGQTLPFIMIGVFMAAAYKIIPGIVKILNSLSQVKTYSYVIEGLRDLEHRHSLKCIHSNIHSVDLENISFAYNGKMILDDLNLQIKKGDFICINGYSASGKTTLVNLLLGFLKPLGGNIFINHTSREETSMHYWPVISYVKQQSFLIHDTVARNICLEEGGYDRERLELVCQITGVDSLIEHYADGLDAVISEEGRNISGGQRQRIILARALYKEFDMLLLDEPFNELDSESEIRLLEYFQKIAAEGKTVILVTHSPLALDFCNKKFAMDES
jgi:ABC-type bacteriocin/lantibiotic exporter with double-glycine peptidase domain